MNFPDHIECDGPDCASPLDPKEDVVIHGPFVDQHYCSSDCALKYAERVLDPDLFLSLLSPSNWRKLGTRTDF